MTRGWGERYRPTEAQGHLRRPTRPLRAPLRSETEGWQDRDLLLSSSGQGGSGRGCGPGRGQLGCLASEKVPGLHEPGPHETRAGEGASLLKPSASPGLFSLSLAQRLSGTITSAALVLTTSPRVLCAVNSERLVPGSNGFALGLHLRPPACPSLTAFCH